MHLSVKSKLLAASQTAPTSARPVAPGAGKQSVKRCLQWQSRSQMAKQIDKRQEMSGDERGDQ
eukprot:6197990-Pleurochrysis_carterae.AAC.6